MVYKTRSLILLSGGLDSATVLAIALKRGDYVEALTFDYGQRNRLELECAANIAAKHEIEHHIIKIDPSPFAGQSSLTGGAELETGRTIEEIEAAGPPSSYVPARNSIFYAFALAIAEGRDLSAIWLGVCQADAAGYVDCRPRFISALKVLGFVATNKRIETMAPLLYSNKALTIKRGLALGVDYSMTSSCYDGSACGVCDACVTRADGFAEVSS